MWQLSLSIVVRPPRQQPPGTPCRPSQTRPPPTMMPMGTTSCMKLASSGDGSSLRVWSLCSKHTQAKARAACHPACFRVSAHPHAEEHSIPGMDPQTMTLVPGTAALVPGMESCSPAAAILAVLSTTLAAVHTPPEMQPVALAQCTLTCPAVAQTAAVGMIPSPHMPRQARAHEWRVPQQVGVSRWQRPG